jgi:uncharacterized protein YjcR
VRKSQNNRKGKIVEKQGAGNSPPVLRAKSKGGAPKGNSNAFKHGRFTARAIALRKRIREHIRYCNAVVLAVERQLKDVRPSPRRPSN